MKNKKKEDNRVKRTKKIIVDALLSLMNAKSFESISITDICEEALISRTTFYVYFQDKYDLLTYIFKNISEEFGFSEGYTKEYHIRLFKAAIKYNKFLSQAVSSDSYSMQYQAKREVITAMQKTIGKDTLTLSENLTSVVLASATEGMMEWLFYQKDSSNIEEVYNEFLKIFNWDHIKTIYQSNN